MSYSTRLMEILEGYTATQSENLNKAAQKCADAIENKGLIHLYGSGHSVIPTMDAYPRYGSFVGLNPLTDPRVMWHNVLGPGGVRELLWLERTENYVDKYLSHEPLAEGDVLICFSHGGTNVAAIEAAMYARDRGLYTIAVTAEESKTRPAKHSSGQRLSDVCDIMINTGCPVEDALVPIEGWDRPLGGSSTVMASITSHEIITRTGAELNRRGIVMPTFVSPTVPGASLESNDEVFEEHARYHHAARARTLP